VSRTRVKICGITSLADARAAVSAGADALGFVFAPGKRHVSADAVAAICRALPPFVVRVGVFVDAELREVQRCLREGLVDRAQLHGAEDAAYLRALRGHAYKAFRIRPGIDPWKEIGHYASADCGVVLLDAWDSRRAGGTGQTFDWTVAERIARRAPLILAGGLHAGNVAAAIARVRPWGVDVSSGVECSPGQKDHRKIEEFVDAVAG
jgi:phosphoribosylanthranilate isomerase